MKYYFAPMEGITTHVFRAVHSRRFPGADRYYTPFFSPTPDHLFTPRELRELTPEMRCAAPVVPQILSKCAADIVWAAEGLQDMGYTVFNLNLGCPSATVTAKGKGAGLLQKPDALNALLKAARDAGWNPYIYCAYRPYLTQEQQYEDQVSENMRKGDTRDEAETAAARVAAPPGTSDHQTGLGADIVDQYYSSLSVDTVNARFLTWLADNCADYGFVIRYPSDKVSITGRNEPWHVRYVGDAAARFMTEHNLCLEEFVALYQ